MMDNPEIDPATPQLSPATTVGSALVMGKLLDELLEEELLDELELLELEEPQYGQFNVHASGSAGKSKIVRARQYNPGI